MQVNFFVAGVQKAGTTALFRMLSRHTDVLIPPRKELHFFDNDELAWREPDYSELLKNYVYPPKSKLLLGDATPIYLYWPKAIERIYCHNPQAKFIVALRHPIFRAYSHWKMEVSRATEALSFADAVSYFARSRVRVAPNGVHRIYSYVERGFYADQLRRILRIFPRNQLLILRTDDFWNDHSGTYTRLCEFLGIGPVTASSHEYVTPYENKVIQEIDGEVRHQLNDVFEEQILALPKVAGINCDDWLQPDYTEPMRNRAE